MMKGFLYALLLTAICTEITHTAPILGDINGNGTVGFEDFLILAKNFGRSGDPAPSDGGPGAPPISAASLNERGFPLDIGNRWRYQGIHIETDSSGALVIRSLTSEWEVEAMEDMFGVDAYRLRVDQSFDENRTYTLFTWFQSSPDMLKAIASQIDSIASPTAQLWKPAIPLFFGNPPDSWPFLSLVFPLAPGKSWAVFSDSDGSPFGSSFGRKAVLSEESLHVPAGAFETYKVQYKMGSESETENLVLIWYGSAGIIKILSYHHHSGFLSLEVYDLVSYDL